MASDLDLGQSISYKFLVANLLEQFLVLGADFLRKFKIKLDFDEKTMTMASKQIKLDYNDYHNMVNLQEAKPTKVLLSTFQVTVHQLTKHEENIYDSTEKLCRQMLKDFPNISGTTDYTDQPKHADRLDLELIKDAPIKQNLCVCSGSKR